MNNSFDLLAFRGLSRHVAPIPPYTSRPRAKQTSYAPYREVSTAEEAQLLEAAQREDCRASLCQQIRKLADPGLAASDALTSNAARLKVRRAVYSRARVIAAATPRPAAPEYETFIRILLVTGLRTRDALRLSWSGLDEQGLTVTLPGVRYQPHRVVEITAEILGLLQLLPQTSPNLFNFGQHELSTAWRRICVGSGLDTLRLSHLRHHAVRKAFFTGKVQTEGDLRAFLGLRRVQHMLCHFCGPRGGASRQGA